MDRSAVLKDQATCAQVGCNIFLPLILVSISPSIIHARTSQVQSSFGLNQAGMQIEEGIKGFKEPATQVVMVSSAAVERNAIIGDDAEARKKDIPIVQLNPGGILNYKYMGENAVRSSGLTYAVVRPVGKINFFNGNVVRGNFLQQIHTPF